MLVRHKLQPHNSPGAIWRGNQIEEADSFMGAEINSAGKMEVIQATSLLSISVPEGTHLRVFFIN